MNTHDEIFFRASSLQNYENCPRMFAANWLSVNELSDQFGLLNRAPVKQNVGAVVGSASHEGHAYLMNAIIDTGEHGGAARRAQAIDVAHSSLDTLWGAEPVSTDQTTPHYAAARHATTKITRQMHLDTKPDVLPVMVEKGHKANYRYKKNGEEYRLTVTGTIDSYLLDRTLPDAKTGRNKPAPFVQLGTYAIILEANGFPVDTLQANYWKRVGQKTAQPPVEVIPIPIAHSKKHALAVTKGAHIDVLELLKKGTPDHIQARPNNYLCDPRFCRAYGTTFCTIGEAVNPNRRKNLK